MRTFQFHEAAELFPLDEEHIDELAADIKKNGQQVEVELLDGKILDGRRRYTACQKIGREVVTRNVQVDDAVAHVLSLNLHRRHLTASQLAMVAARAKGIYEKQAKDRQRLSEGPGVKGTAKSPYLFGQRGEARELAGKAVGCGGSSVGKASLVLKHGVPELVKAVDAGKVSVWAAAEKISEPAEAQRAFAESPPPRSLPNRQVESDRTPSEIKVIGVGIVHANEAINSLTRIPKNDALRQRGFQLVTDWIRRNK